jgi:hypothetical protein
MMYSHHQEQTRKYQNNKYSKHSCIFSAKIMQSLISHDFKFKFFTFFSYAFI